MRKVIDKVNVLFNNEYSKNIFIVFSGSIFAQLVSIITIPILSRIYSPESYGYLGFFISIGSVLFVFSNFRLSHSIMIEENNEDAFKMLKISIGSVLITSIFIFILSVLYYYLESTFKIKYLKQIILFIPFYVLFSGINELLLIWISRNKLFKKVSINRILISVLTFLITFLLSVFFGPNYKGLIIGIIIPQFISLLYLSYSVHKKRKFKINLNINEIKFLILKHKKFPLYALPSDLINTLTNQLPIFLIGKFSTIQEVGYYNMSNKILGLPSFFISSSVGEVFRQKATEIYLQQGNCVKIFNNTFKSLLLIGFIPFMLFGLIGPFLFKTILGADWEEAGKYSQIFFILFYLRFIISPLTYVFYIAGKQKIDLIGHFFMLIFTFIPFYFGFTYYKNLKLSLLLFTISYSLIYIAYLILSIKFCRNEKTN